MSRYAALIPIKDHSERVPGKNFRPLEGRPLWQHVVATLHAVERIGRIYINTDSARFTAEALAPFPRVTIIPRPAVLCGDFVPTNHLFAHDLTQVPAYVQSFVQTHTTNPLLTVSTVERALDAFEAAQAAGTADSLFTVTPHFARFYRRDLSAVNHDPAVLLRTQDLDPLLEENSNLYIFSRESFAATGARIGRRPVLFEMDRLEATDIDDPPTWALAEALLRQRSAPAP